VIEFFQRADWDPDNPVALRETEYFKILNDQLVNFRLSFPPEVREPDKVNPENSGYFLAHALAHTTTVLLHGMFVTDNPEDPSIRISVTVSFSSPLVLLSQMILTVRSSRSLDPLLASRISLRNDGR
jgi:hypothetical protein